MSGIGKAIICDPDVVELSNLSRTVLFRSRDIGSLKVDAAAAALTELAPEMEVQVRPQPLVHGIGLAELRDANLVLSCLDSRSSRLQLTGRCQLVEAPYIDGGTHPWGGEVRPFLKQGGACYGCSLSAEERGIADVAWSCLNRSPEDPIGAAIPSSALVGTWMGMMAIRFLMGIEVPNGILKIDGVRGTTSVVTQDRAPDCPMHQPLKGVEPVPIRVTDTVGDLRKILPAGAIPYVHEPVQQRVECRQCGYQAQQWQLPRVAPCPDCGNVLLPRTTLTFEEAPADLPLTALGIPPREILSVKTATGFKAIELVG